MMVRAGVRPKPRTTSGKSPPGRAAGCRPAVLPTQIQIIRVCILTRLSQLAVAFLRFRPFCWGKCLIRKVLLWRSACSEDLGPRLIDTSFIECRHIPALHATIGGSQTLRYWNVVESTACRWASGTHPHRRRATITAVTLHPARSRTQHIAAAIAAVPSRAAPTQNIGHPRAQTRPPGSARVVKTYGLAPSKTNHLPAVSGPS